MRYILLRVFLFAILGVAFFSAVVHGQTFEYKDGRKLEIEFVQEPPCPVRISVKSVNLKPAPESQLITLQIENLSSKSIRAYAMVSGGNRHPNMHTTTFGAAPFEPGKTLLRGVWPNSQEHYYFFFDYILFTDGTTCGNDNHRRSNQIASYLEARAVAIARLREFSFVYLNPDEFVTAVEKYGAGGYISFDNPGPPNPETIKLMPRRAYEHVIASLRQIQNRQKEALEIANKLEREIPQ